MTNYICENILVCIVWHFISEYLYFYNHLCYYNLFSSNDVFLYNESRNKYFCTSQSSDTGTQKLYIQIFLSNLQQENYSNSYYNNIKTILRQNLNTQCIKI